MRYYVNFIENTINGENRSVPKAYTDLDSAMAFYHKTMGSDISSEQVLGAQAMVWNSAGGIHINDTWGVMVTPPAPVEPEPEVVETETTEETTDVNE